MDLQRPYLDFPLRFDPRGYSAVTDADDHVRDMIYLVLFTSPGERVNRPEFGCGVKQLVFAPLADALAAASEQMIHGALIRWLDSVILVEKVSVVANDATLEITIRYVRRDSGERREDLFKHAVPM